MGRGENEGRGRVVRSTALDEVVTRTKCTEMLLKLKRLRKREDTLKKHSNCHRRTKKTAIILSQFSVQLNAEPFFSVRVVSLNITSF